MFIIRLTAIFVLIQACSTHSMKSLTSRIVAIRNHRLPYQYNATAKTNQPFLNTPYSTSTLNKSFKSPTPNKINYQSWRKNVIDAALYKEWHNVTKLIKEGTSFEFYIPWAALFSIAIQNNDPSAVEVLVNIPNVNLEVEGGFPLREAVQYRNAKIAEILLKAGASQSKTDIFDKTIRDTAFKTQDKDLINVFKKYSPRFSFTKTLNHWLGRSEE